MFESLQEKLEESFKKLKGEGKITEINVATTLKDVRKALVSADVNYKVADQFMKTVKEKALGQSIITAAKPKEMLMQIVFEELKSMMGGALEPINTEGKPAIILMAGLNGIGKTTFSAKLAKLLRSKRGKRPLLIAGDVYRPAAIDQLKVLAESVNVPVYSEEGNQNAVQIALNGIQYAKDQHLDLVIIDTAGRQTVDEELMDEIAAIKNAVNPGEILFVVDAMTGQEAVTAAKAFNDRLDYTGVVLTKMDGDARGGAAVSIRAVVNKPIKYVGTGEKMEDLEEFDPAGMASRILGQGDLMALAKRAQDLIDEDEAKKLEEKLRKNKFDFDDFLSQIQKIKKMGNLKNLASLIPGVGKAIKDVEIDDNAFKSIEAIIGSMTPFERHNPDKIDSSRRKRIAKGSGTKLEEVNRLLKQFEQTRKMMHMTAQMKGNPAQMMRQMKQMQQRRR